MKKYYEPPYAEIEKFNIDYILTVSSESGGGIEEGGEEIEF